MSNLSVQHLHSPYRPALSPFISSPGNPHSFETTRITLLPGVGLGSRKRLLAALSHPSGVRSSPWVAIIHNCSTIVFGEGAEPEAHCADADIVTKIQSVEKIGPIFHKAPTAKRIVDSVAHFQMENLPLHCPAICATYFLQGTRLTCATTGEPVGIPCP